MNCYRIVEAGGKLDLSLTDNIVLVLRKAVSEDGIDVRGPQGVTMWTNKVVTAG